MNDSGKPTLSSEPTDATARASVRHAGLATGDSLGSATHGRFRYHRGASHCAALEAAFQAFEKDLGAPAKQASVWRLSNASVLGGRFALAVEGRLVQESLYLNRQPEAAESDLWQRYRLESPAAVLGNTIQGNYYHLTAQYLPALIHYQTALAGAYAQFVIVRPELRPFEARALQLLANGSLPHLVLPQTAAVSSKTVAYSDMLSARGPMFPYSIRQTVAERVKEALGLAPLEPKLRIYVSRRDSARRRMLNELSLERELSRRGFVVVVPGELSLDEQVKLFHQAAVVVGPHGAGMANVLYCQPGAVVLELFQQSYMNPCMRVLGESAGVNYWCDAFADDGRGQRTAGWQVDIDLVCKTLSLSAAAA